MIGKAKGVIYLASVTGERGWEWHLLGHVYWGDKFTFRELKINTLNHILWFYSFYATLWQLLWKRFQNLWMYQNLKKAFWYIFASVAWSQLSDLFFCSILLCVMLFVKIFWQDIFRSIISVINMCSQMTVLNTTGGSVGQIFAESV